MKRVLISCFRKRGLLGLFLCFPFTYCNSVALADDLPKLLGRWVKTSNAARSDQPGVGAWIKIDADRIIYQSWAAPATLAEAHGQHGANFVWRNSVASCWYEISRVETRTNSDAVTAKLTLKLVKGDPPQVCLEDSVFEPAPTATTGKPIVHSRTEAVDSAISKLFLNGFRSDRPLNTGTKKAERSTINKDTPTPLPPGATLYAYGGWPELGDVTNMSVWVDATRVTKAIRIGRYHSDGKLKQMYLTFLEEVGDASPTPIFFSKRELYPSDGEGPCASYRDITTDNVRAAGKVRYNYRASKFIQPCCTICDRVKSENFSEDIWILFD